VFGNDGENPSDGRPEIPEEKDGERLFLRNWSLGFERGVFVCGYICVGVGAGAGRSASADPCRREGRFGEQREQEGCEMRQCVRVERPDECGGGDGYGGEEGLGLTGR
jgi:hypothetical protein